MASFQAKTWWDRLRVRENKIIVPIHSNPTRNTEFQKTSKKIQKIKKHHYATFQAKTGRDRPSVIKKKKKKLSFRSIPTRLKIGNSKKIAKKCKKLRNIIMALFQGKTWQDMLSVIQKKKSYRSDPFQQDLN